jgi:hypothetical protein
MELISSCTGKEADRAMHTQTVLPLLLVVQTRDGIILVVVEDACALVAWLVVEGTCVNGQHRRRGEKEKQCVCVCAHTHGDDQEQQSTR